MKKNLFKINSIKKKLFSTLNIFWLLFVLACVGLSACGGTGASGPVVENPSEDPSPTPTQDPDEPPDLELPGPNLGNFSFPVVIEEHFDYPNQNTWPGWFLPEGAPSGGASIENQQACLAGPANTLARMVLTSADLYEELEATYTAYPENLHTQGMGFYAPQNGYYLNGGMTPGQGLVVYFEGGLNDDLGFWTEIGGVEVKRAATLLNTVLGETVTPEAGFPPDPAFRVRYQVRRTGYEEIRLRARLWRMEEAEPEVWHLEYIVDTSLGGFPMFQDFAGTLALDVYNYNVPGRACFDDIVVTHLNPNPLEGLLEPVEVASGFGFTEGPVWVAEDNSLLFSDIQGDALYAFNHGTGVVAEYRGDQNPDAFANGLARAINGDLIICEQNQQRLVRRASDGSQSTIVSQLGGVSFNSPNDVAVLSNGDIYFTDPTYGTIFNPTLLQPLGFQGIYHFQDDGTLNALYTNETEEPNGIAFSPDESRAYVAFTVPAQVQAYQVLGDGSFAEINGEGFPINLPAGGDGIKVDLLGNLYVASGNQVRVYGRFGEPWGEINLPAAVRNLAFGGPELRHLYITAGGSLYRVEANIPGLVLPGTP